MSVAWRYWWMVLALLLVGAAHARASSANVTIHTGGLQLGSLALRDVTVSVHTTESSGTRTCISASLENAKLRGCGWLQQRDGQLFLRDGHISVVVPRRTSVNATLARTTVDATLSGNLSRLDLELSGSAKTDLLELRSQLASATLHALELPFSVRIRRDKTTGALAIDEASPLTVRVRSGSLKAVDASLAVTPIITLHPGWPHWRADVAWSGVDLGPTLSAASDGRIAGTGSLAGELAFRGDGTRVELVRGFAFAVHGGELRIKDPQLRASLVSSFRDRLAIQQRLAATLSDFAYSKLALTFGANPLIQISIHGRGKRVAQDLYLAVNLRKSS